MISNVFETFVCYGLDVERTPLFACEVCRDLDGKHFKVKDMMPGENAPPMHPNCRCSTAAYMERDDFNKWMDGKEDVENRGKDDTIKKIEDIGIIDVYTVGKIDRNIYKCITKDIVTDDVIITDERIQHIKERHPNNYECFCGYIPDIIKNPDYIIEANKPNTAVILKEIEDQGEKFKLVLRLKVKSDPAEYKNSIMTFWHIGDTTWRKSLKNKKILYKHE